MNQHTYSFPKVTPVDPDELREDLRLSRRHAAGTDEDADRVIVRREVQAHRADRQN